MYTTWKSLHRRSLNEILQIEEILTPVQRRRLPKDFVWYLDRTALVWRRINDALVWMLVNGQDHVNATYDGVAAHSPLLASELAARAASASHSAGQTELALTLLEKSLSLHPALTQGVELDAAGLGQIRRQRGSGRSPSELEIALKLLRGISVDSDDYLSQSAFGDPTFEDFLRRFGTPKRA